MSMVIKRNHQPNLLIRNIPFFNFLDLFLQKLLILHEICINLKQENENKLEYNEKKGNPMHKAPVYVGHGEELDHIESIVPNLTLHCKRQFPQLKSVTTKLHGNNFT